jgi:hypothetical protein
MPGFFSLFRVVKLQLQSILEYFHYPGKRSISNHSQFILVSLGPGQFVCLFVQFWSLGNISPYESSIFFIWENVVIFGIFFLLCAYCSSIQINKNKISSSNAKSEIITITILFYISQKIMHTHKCVCTWVCVCVISEHVFLAFNILTF